MGEEKFPYRVGPWLVDSRDVAFENPWIRIEDSAVTHPNGAPGRYGVVRFANRAIGVLALDAEGRTPLIGQHRFPLDQYSWELPEGGGPLDEAPLAAAKRELNEEAGIEAAHWTLLGEADLSNSVTDEAAIAFLAWDLTLGTANPEPSEELTLKWVAFSALHEAVLAGEIRDSLTILMVLWARAKAEAGALPEPVARLLL